VPFKGVHEFVDTRDTIIMLGHQYIYHLYAHQYLTIATKIIGSTNSKVLLHFCDTLYLTQRTVIGKQKIKPSLADTNTMRIIFLSIRTFFF
jgi:hypothetical protein